MYTVLSSIGKRLNDAGIVWGIGASMLLSQFGLVEKPNDIDICVDSRDIEKADEILKSIGVKKELNGTPLYATKQFYEYIVDGVEVDVMAGLAVYHAAGVFEYVFDKASITDFKIINGVSIPFASLEDWYVLYQLLPNRERKVSMIEEYLMANGIKHPFLLKRVLEGNLPEEVRKRVANLLMLRAIP